MTPLAAVVIFLAGVIVGASLAYLDAPGWLLHALARLQGGEWIGGGHDCPGCKRRVHVVRHDPMAAAAGDGPLCPRCAGKPGPDEGN